MKEFAPTTAGESCEESHSNLVSEGLIPLAEQLADGPTNCITPSSAIKMSGDTQDLAQPGAFQQLGTQDGMKAAMSGVPFAMISLP